MSAWQPLVVHSLRSSHVIRLPPHEPPLHASLSVHRSSSLHPIVLSTLVHPSAGSQSSSVHSFSSSQSGTPDPSSQVPLSHTSLRVHRLPSSQGWVVYSTLTPVSGSQLRTLHTSPVVSTGSP